MPGNVESRLLVLVLAVSLALTGLTVWAVACQGRALQARELADLSGAAATAAAQYNAGLLGALHRAFDAAGRVWRTGGADELDAWVADQRNWLLACADAGDGAWMIFPRTPLEQPLPGPRDPNDQGAPSDGYDLNATLEYFKRLATSPDPLTRAGALLASATCEQQLGHPLAAARILTDAAALLRSTPGLARFAFRAELARIDSLVAASDHERARETMAGFLSGILADHPARLGPTEMARLKQQAGTLGLAGEDPLLSMLAELERRAERRESMASAASGLLETKLPATNQPVDEVAFVSGPAGANQPLVIAVRTIADNTRLALVAPAESLLGRFCKTPNGGAWQVTLPGQSSSNTVLAKLGPAFAHAMLVPTPATAAGLQAAARWHLATVVATAAGSVGAWVLVIWMMVRAVGRQRELAHLQGRFVADISHELKTPLALIRLLSETLAEQRVRDPERIRNYHETITREAERLTALLDNILDLGRIESGRKQYEFAECSVADVTRQAWSLFEAQFARDRFDARLEIAGELPMVRADPAALQQVLVNLLQNAYRYAGDGKYVRLSVVRDGHLAVFTVEDHGIGMNRGQLKRLGESFFRAEDTRVRQTRGAGLGLAIVSHIVTAHRGKIEVHSRPGQGSTFTVWIPLDDRQVNRPVERAPITPAR